MSKRNILIMIVCWACALAMTACSHTPEHPDVIIFVADDLGWHDVGYHGSEIRTPNIDSLARKGIVLEHFYAYPVCSPTRTALMTGRSAISLGIVRPINAVTEGGLPLDERILPQVFKDAGYQTFMCGKWHLGASHVKYFPHNRGFDHFYGHLGGFLDYYDHVFTGGLDWQRNGKSVREEGYTTELIANEAVRLLHGRDKSKPTLLYVAFNAPHLPLQAPQSYIDKYADIKDEARRTYAAMVDAMDAAIGKILAAVDEEGMTKDTFVIFFSDNGGARRAGSNEPLRGGKGTVFEGGIRLPAVMWWPGVLEGGRQWDQFITVHDLLPTLAAAIHTEVGNTKPLYGDNLWPALRDLKIVPRKDIIIGGGRNFAVFHGEWKLVRAVARGQSGPTTYLFRIREDPDEKNNLAAENPDLVKQLEAEIDAFPKGKPLGGPPPGARARGRRPAGARPRQAGQQARRSRPGPGGQPPDGDSAGGPETRQPWAEAASRE